MNWWIEKWFSGLMLVAGTVVVIAATICIFGAVWSSGAPDYCYLSCRGDKCAGVVLVQHRPWVWITDTEAGIYADVAAAKAAADAISCPLSTAATGSRR